MSASIRNVVFNPQMGSLAHICEVHGKEGFALFQVVSVHQYESVAVFVEVREHPTVDVRASGGHLEPVYLPRGLGRIDFCGCDQNPCVCDGALKDGRS